MSRCARCGKKSIYHRAKTNDYRCKSCSHVSSKTREQIEDEQIIFEEEYRKSPEGKAEKRKEEDEESQGCMFIIFWVISSLILSIPITNIVSREIIKFFGKGFDSLIVIVVFPFSFLLSFYLIVLLTSFVVRIKK